MKKLIIVFAGFFSILSVSAQNDRRYDNNQNNQNNRGYNNYNNSSIVTLTLTGNANERVMVDGQSYNSRNYGNNSIQITNLQPGQHTLQVTNSSAGRSILGGIFSRNNNNVSTTFNLRSGYDMNIVLNANGRARITETRSLNYQNNRRNNRYNRDNNNPNYNRQ